MTVYISLFLFFCFVPQCIHFFEAHFSEGFADADGMLFDVVEAANELLVGTFQGVLGVQVVEPFLSLSSRASSASSSLSSSCTFVQTSSFFCQSKPTLRALS